MILNVLAAGVGVIVVAITGTILVGAYRWRRRVAAPASSLVEDAAVGEPIPGEALPGPVARFLERAVPETAPPAAATVRLTQAGTFQMGEDEQGWRPFSATEVMAAFPPGFYWDAAIRMAPGLTVRVLDAYVHGSATMVGKILGVVPVVDAADDSNLRQGALSRYLAEAAWLPTRLGMTPGLTWHPVDETSAEAVLTDRGTTVRLRFRFDRAGDLVQVHGLRSREVEGTYVDTPWIGRFGEHREMGGYRIPTWGEVAWVVDGEERPYWRGRITGAAFTPAI